MVEMFCRLRCPTVALFCYMFRSRVVYPHIDPVAMVRMSIH